MSKKSWIVFVVICVGLLGGLIFLSNQNKTDVSGVNSKEIQLGSAASGDIADQVYGNKSSKVVLVEYGDFQCPGCGSLHPRVKTVMEEYKDKVAFVFRNFPLSSIHPNALSAAAAAEAAGLQGKYWEMHNKLFESQSAWSDLAADKRTDIFVSYAKSLGLNETTFREDLGSENVALKIRFDQALGKSQGANSTPTLFLNGELLSQEAYADEAALRKTFDEALK